MQRLVCDGGIVHDRQVPDYKNSCPNRKRYEWVAYKTDPPEGRLGEQGAQERSCEADRKQDWSNVCEEDVLDHVSGEHLFGERVERWAGREGENVELASRLA